MRGIHGPQIWDGRDCANGIQCLDSHQHISRPMWGAVRIKRNDLRRPPQPHTPFLLGPPDNTYCPKCGDKYFRAIRAVHDDDNNSPVDGWTWRRCTCAATGRSCAPPKVRIFVQWSKSLIVGRTEAMYFGLDGSTMDLYNSVTWSMNTPVTSRPLQPTVS